MKKSTFLKKYTSKIICLSVSIILAFSATIITSSAATTKTVEGLITSVSNPSHRKISFYINAPAGKTVSYKVQLIPNKRTGSIDTVSGSYKNSSTSTVKKKISVTVDYYSDLYTVTASYTTGTVRNKTTYSDVDKAISKLDKTVYTKKFVWNDANIKTYTRNNRIVVSLVFATGVGVDFLVTKGYVSGVLSTMFTITSFTGDLLTAGSVADTKSIQVSPIVGWAYRFKLVPNGNGYKRYLEIFDEYGRLYSTISYGGYSSSYISKTAY